MPIILEAHSRGEPWVTDPSLVELLEATSDQSIFRYLRESHHFPQLGIGEKIKLFRLCVHELESELIKFLYENRNTMEPWRSDVADALGEFGGKESLEAIKAMLSELSELGAPPNTADAPTPASILDHFVRSAQFQFREKLRSARDRLQHRGID